MKASAMTHRRTRSNRIARPANSRGGRQQRHDDASGERLHIQSPPLGAWFVCSEDVGTTSGSLIASRRLLVGSANTKRNVEDTMNSDRPSLPMSKRPLGAKFASAKIVGSPLYVATGSIAIARASPRG